MQYINCTKQRTMNPLKTKLSEVREAAAAGNWKQAILKAAKFGDLGNERNDILSAREAINRPDFMRQLRRDPETLIAAGINALKQRYQL